MRYDRILWLDDAPDTFLQYLLVASKEWEKQIDPEKLFQRTRFAYDFDSGKAALRESEFDLVILDGSFPKQLPGERAAHIDSRLADTCRGKLFAPHIRPHINCGDVQDNYFVKFYLENFQDRREKVVVCSGGEECVLPALEMGLPFYCKMALRDIVAASFFEAALHERSSRPDVAAWEHGSMKALAERYLL